MEIVKAVYFDKLRRMPDIVDNLTAHLPWEITMDSLETQ